MKAPLLFRGMRMLVRSFLLQSLSFKGPINLPGFWCSGKVLKRRHNCRSTTAVPQPPCRLKQKETAKKKKKKKIVGVLYLFSFRCLGVGNLFMARKFLLHGSYRLWTFGESDLPFSFRCMGIKDSFAGCSRDLRLLTTIGFLRQRKTIKMKSYNRFYFILNTYVLFFKLF